MASLRDILRRRFAAAFWPPRFLEISAGFWPPRFRNLGRILAAEIQKARWPKSCRESRRDLGKNFVRGRLRLTRLMLGLQRFQVVVKSHPLGKNYSPLLNSVLLPIRFGRLHTLHFSNITLFSTQNSLLITSWLKAVKWRNVLEKLRRLLWRYAFQKKNRQSNVPCTLWDEDRENVVECRYGQLSSTEKIEKKKNKRNQEQYKTK